MARCGSWVTGYFRGCPLKYLSIILELFVVRLPSLGRARAVIKLVLSFRHTNIQLESEIESMIHEFDEKMFHLYNELSELSASYEVEKEELIQAK